MAENRDSKIRLELELSPHQPGLLEGLNQWLQLGLISDEQVRHLCQEQLSCEFQPNLESAPLPDSPLPTSSGLVNPFEEASHSLAAETSADADFWPDSEAPASSQTSSPGRSGQASSPPSTISSTAESLNPAQASASRPRPVGLWLDRIMSELSVVWLLGLGVFLVVLSSAVLAATQWARFNAVSQYLVLLAYTLVFWGIGVWSSRQHQLQLTSRTLQMITLLLVPLNFWAMDGLGVGRSAGGVVVAGVAAALLTLATLQVMGKQNTPWIKQGNALGLAYLHTGWGFAAVPVLAVYGGVLGSAAVTLVTRTYGPGMSESGQRQAAVAEGNLRTAAATSASSAQSTATASLAMVKQWSTLAVFFALGLLLLRGLSVLPGDDWGQLGLAFGMYGATWVWLGQRRLGPAQTDATTSSLPRGSPWLGRGLLWWGWLIAMDDFRAQAFGVSLLGLALRWQALQKLGRRRDLLVAYGIAVQLAFVGWQLVPPAIRGVMMTPLSAWARVDGGQAFALLGLSLFPYVGAMVALADGYLQRGQRKLGQFSDGIALGSNLLLTGFSLFSHPVLVVHLIASSITALIGTWRRTPVKPWRIVLSYGLALVTVVVTIDYLWPDLSDGPWTVVITTLAVLWFGLSRGLPGLWGRTAWPYGLGLSGLSYVLLGSHLSESNWQSSLSWIGFLIPLTLTFIGRYRISVLATMMALPLTFGMSWTRLVGLGTATGLTVANSTIRQRRWVSFIAIGLGLGFVVSTLADLVPAYPDTAADWCVVTVGLIATLWIAFRRLPYPEASSQAPSLSGHYRSGADTWGHLLTVGLLVYLSLSVGSIYAGFGGPRQMFAMAQIGLLLGLGLRYWGQVQPTAIYLSGWGIELLLAEFLAWREPTAVALAVPTLGLGAGALVLATLIRRSQPVLIPSLQTLALAYAILALALRSTTATAWTGWLVVGAALLLLEGGRRNHQGPLRWLALLLLSLGWYELVFYQLWQTEAGSQIDGVIVLSGVAALIMAVYRLAAARIARHLHLPQAELMGAAHIHWGLGSLMLLGVGSALPFTDANLAWLGVIIATVLFLYALLQGRLGNRNNLSAGWVYAGLVELVGWFAILRFTVPALQVLDSWWGAVACAVAVPVYWVPWSHHGWPQRPWRVMAVGVPLIITGLTQGVDHIPSLWILAGFYGWLAWHSRRVRVSYLSAGCMVWAIWVWLEQQNIQDALAFVLPLGLALLYGAQVDPDLSRPEAKGARHWLRLLAVGIILLMALFSERWTGWPVGLMGLAAIAAGLFFRIRALLYVGTVVFVLNALNQLILLNSTYPLIKWVVGILVGIGLIWIAADFERRRDQWVTITQNWMQDLDGWQ